MLGIAPFNFPLNLCAHKVAPAIAAGAPIILKPAPATPLSGLILGDLLAETDLPAGSWSSCRSPTTSMPALVQDERLPVISFTGSEKVGYAIMDSVPRKHCTLELGGNGAAVVLADYASDADLDWAADPHRDLLQLPGRPVLHLGAAGHRGRRRLRPAAAEASSPPSRPRSPATRPTTPPTSARWSARPPPSASRRGWTRPSRRARSCSPAASATAPRTRRPSSPTSRGHHDRLRGGLRPGAHAAAGWTARPRPSPPSTTPSTASRRACSPTTCRPPSAPTARWRSAA